MSLNLPVPILLKIQDQVDSFALTVQAESLAYDPPTAIFDCFRPVEARIDDQFGPGARNPQRSNYQVLIEQPLREHRIFVEVDEVFHGSVSVCCIRRQPDLFIRKSLMTIRVSQAGSIVKC